MRREVDLRFCNECGAPLDGSDDGFSQEPVEVDRGRLAFCGLGCINAYAGRLSAEADTPPTITLEQALEMVRDSDLD